MTSPINSGTHLQLSFQTKTELTRLQPQSYLRPIENPNLESSQEITENRNRESNLHFSELIRGIEYFTDRLAEKWAEIGCNSASSLVEFVDGECVALHQEDRTFKKKYRKFWRFYNKVLQVLDKTPRMSKLKW